MTTEKAQIWGIFWGELSAFDKHPEAFRVCFDKTRDPREAAKKLFGIVADNMHAKPMGSSVSYLRVNKNWKAEIAKANWQPLARKG